MVYLSNEFKKIFKKNENINKFKLDFDTGGQYKYNHICIDLMPHALSFMFTYFKQFHLKKKFNIKKIIITKNMWSSHFIYNKINFYFCFSENLKKKTSFEIEIDNKRVERFTNREKNNFDNFLRYNGKIKKIKNPLSKFFLELKKIKTILLFLKIMNS